MFNQSLPGRIIYHHFNTQVYKESKLCLIFLAITIFSFGIISCSETVAPGIASQPYMSLSIGDERQIVSITDSSTIQWVITDTLRRADGELVFRILWYYGTYSLPDTNYYFIKDGYFIGTDLDTLKDTTFYVLGSYFGEQKIGKTFPLNGESWSNKFYSSGDTTVTIFTAQSSGLVTTPAGVFNDCFRFVIDFGPFVIYARNVGYIGLSMNDSTGYTATYLKINGREYGIKVPPKNPPGWWKPETKESMKYLFGQIR